MPLSVFNMDAHCQSWSFMPHLSCHPTVFINNLTATLLCWLATAHSTLESCNSVYHPYFPVLLFSHVARQFWDLIQRLEFHKLIVLQQFFCIYLVFDSLTWSTLEPLVLAVWRLLLWDSPFQQPAPFHVVLSTSPNKRKWLKWAIVPERYCLLQSMCNSIINQAVVRNWVTSVRSLRMVYMISLWNHDLNTNDSTTNIFHAFNFV